MYRDVVSEGLEHSRVTPPNHLSGCRTTRGVDARGIFAGVKGDVFRVTAPQPDLCGRACLVCGCRDSTACLSSPLHLLFPECFLLFFRTHLAGKEQHIKSTVRGGLYYRSPRMLRIVINATAPRVGSRFWGSKTPFVYMCRDLATQTDTAELGAEEVARPVAALSQLGTKRPEKLSTKAAAAATFTSIGVPSHVTGKLPNMRLLKPTPVQVAAIPKLLAGLDRSGKDHTAPPYG